ncbi:class I SAM-dependent methyltransferase [candidate division WOR-3 bacterium]|nr:class I SAM-dependent methyltransferase [candidate division WOR-3 bacterium]
MASPGPGEVSPASFRDPSGFVFLRAGRVLRQVNKSYAPDYDQLMESGLYRALVDAGRLIPHEETDEPAELPDECYRVLAPEPVPLISYPYEWCFSQLKDAALATLAIQLRAMEHGMALKDASAYNIQFVRGRPVMIDTLSFERYREGEPWVAYRQFCQHFLAPLALMSRTDVRLGQLFRVYIDGVPLDLASRLLPGRTRWSLGLATHVHLHARTQQRYADRQGTAKRRPVTRLALTGIIRSLENTVRGLRWRPGGTEWAEYYDATNYSTGAFKHKQGLVERYLDRVRPRTVWDLGANTGEFTRLAAERGIPSAAFDIDPAAVEKNYRDCRERGEENILPLVLDLTNPSPGIGWENEERMSIAQRGPADLTMALALVHHLAISNNLPLSKVARFFSHVGAKLIVEFVPKTDSQVKRLLSTRADIFPGYTREEFERYFGERFRILESSPVEGSERTLYLMERKTTD